MITSVTKPEAACGADWKPEASKADCKIEENSFGWTVSCLVVFALTLEFEWPS